MSIKVLVAEDSTYQRNLIAEMVSSHEDIQVIDLARNGKEAIEKIEKHNPDVVLLDLIMPEVDGLTVLKFLIEHYPIPTIIFTAINLDTLDDSVQALILGAFDFIIKPKGYWKDEFPKFKDKLISSILYAGKIKKTYEKRNNLIINSINEPVNIDLYEKSPVGKNIDTALIKEYIKVSKFKSNLIVIGTSTGGPRTLKAILKHIPKDFPSPILMVQHLDAFFMKQFSNSLDQICQLDVKIPEDGEKIYPGTAYLSPGGKHMKVVLRNNIPHIKTFVGKPVNFCMPSVDVLFFSAAEIYKDDTLGVLLTGLGDDGAAGLNAIKNAGGKTIAESEETCVVYGMPKSAVKLGAAQFIVPSYRVKDYLINFARKFSKNLSN